MSRFPLSFRDVAITLSLSNLLFLKGWLELLEGVRHPYFRKEMVLYWIDFAALALDVAFLAGLFLFAVLVARRIGNKFVLKFVHGVFLVASVFLAILVYNILRRHYPAVSLGSLADRFGELAVGIVLFIVLASAGFLYRKYRPSLVTLAANALLIVAPFLVVTFGKSVWLGLGLNAETKTQREVTTERPPDAASPKVRVLWFIFDNLDYRLTFLDRPEDLQLPALDRLRGESFSAANATSPASVTGRAMPALFSGWSVARAIPVTRDDLAVTLEETGEVVRWSDMPNLFKRARAAGFGTAAVGWYHPYCRVLPESFSYCTWMGFRAARPPIPVLKSMAEFLQQATPPWARFDILSTFGLVETDWDGAYHIETFKQIRDEARNLIANPDYDLVFVHWPIPHAPYIYDREKGDFSLASRSHEKYLDNLVLTDRTVGRLRQDLEEAGLWDSTILLISSDHAWGDAHAIDGKRDPRIPFLLKLAGSSEPVAYERAFDTVLTSDLLFSLLTGELSNSEDVVQWFENRLVISPD